MSWREAKSLTKLLEQINARWPGRSKISDGEMGDTAHQQRKSDHDPNAAGVVTALDITNDPNGQPNSRRLAETLVASRDKRIKYLISNGQICSSTVAPWVWRPYHGPNGHFHHVHISVSADPRLYDDQRAWNLGDAAPGVTRQLKLGDRGNDVATLQTALKITVNRFFDADTEKAVKTFQATHGLREDGLVGPQTRTALGI
jgi:murein L,D-transpeptidase YcbB/YkuD